MKTTWKFPLLIQDEQEIQMPIDAEILCVQTQGGSPCLWALVDDEVRTAARHIHIRGTGHSCRGVGEYISTFQMYDGALVYHVFDNGWAP